MSTREASPLADSVAVLSVLSDSPSFEDLIVDMRDCRPTTILTLRNPRMGDCPTAFVAPVTVGRQ